MSQPSKGFLDLFDTDKPILAMLHLSGSCDEEIMERARGEIETFAKNGVHAVIVENYFGSERNVKEVLAYLDQTNPGIVYGVNVLGNDELAFELADRYNASFIQLDSVAGHLAPRDDRLFAIRLKELRAASSAYVLGGVRFKYQPVLSGNSTEIDLELAMERCDAIVVTGEGTGIETDLAKVRHFRSVVGNGFPLFVGAGLNPKNVHDQLDIADGAIVGSYFKENHSDKGKLVDQYVQELMTAVRAI